MTSQRNLIKQKAEILTIWTVDGDQQKKISIALDTPDRVVQWQVGRDVAVANITGYSSLKDDSAILAIMYELNLDDTDNLEKSNPKPKVFPISPQNVTNTTFRKVTVKINGNNVEWETEDTELNLTSEKIETICDILNHAEWNAHAFDDPEKFAEIQKLRAEFEQTSGQILVIETNDGIEAHIALDTPSRIIQWNDTSQDNELIQFYSILNDESTIFDTSQRRHTIPAIFSSLPISI